MCPPRRIQAHRRRGPTLAALERASPEIAPTRSLGRDSLGHECLGAPDETSSVRTQLAEEQRVFPTDQAEIDDEWLSRAYAGPAHEGIVGRAFADRAPGRLLKSVGVELRQKAEVALRRPIELRIHRTENDVRIICPLRSGQIRQPVRACLLVVIDQGEEAAAGVGEACVARMGDPGPRLMDVADRDDALLQAGDHSARQTRPGSCRRRRSRTVGRSLPAASGNCAARYGGRRASGRWE